MSVDIQDNLHLVIVTPSGEKYNDGIIEGVFPGVAGDIGVLPHHIALVSSLRIGIMKLKKPGSKVFELYSTTGGFVQIEDNKIKVLAETAELKNEIDVERAKSAKERAEERINAAKQKRKDDIDLARAESALIRAKNRLEIAFLK